MPVAYLENSQHLKLLLGNADPATKSRLRRAPYWAALYSNSSGAGPVFPAPVTPEGLARQYNVWSGWSLWQYGGVNWANRRSEAKVYSHPGRSFPTWMHAARAMKELSGHIYPSFQTADWLRLAKRLMVVSGSGRIALDYDMKIAEPMLAADKPVDFDMWPAWHKLAERPVLALRGELSDLLSEATFQRMAQASDKVEAVTVPGVGHTPTLEEPVALEAIARLLAKVSGGGAA